MDDFDLEVQCEEYYGPEESDWLEHVELSGQDQGFPGKSG